MIFADSLFWGNVAEDVILLLIVSTHVPWTCSALLRYKILGFFRSLLVCDLPHREWCLLNYRLFRTLR